ncbi:MAG: class I SAM-dependent methyltransferase [Labilithrix sp.]|nr:class I SAM-dependent methyltransferase [Labilithrix sp.]MCW5814435.1 class I SAM-dependent methyltransferase [Labilithrix sp.]
MDRARVWPFFRPEDVLFEDDDLLVVHKPAGVASQAADPTRPDDLVTRLRAHLGGAYLGVHQRLDRDTSGVVLFTKRPEANAAIAAQMERRSLEKRYLAGVVGWRGPKRVTLTDDLVPGEDKTMRVASKTRSRPRQKPQRAVTHVTLRATRGDRALLDLVLETGRTHQARVQLAHAGAPIAGDPIYGGAPAPAPAPAPRLLLHASSLTLDHPRTKKRLVIEDPRARPELEAWLTRGDLGYAVYDDRAALDRALSLALERRWGLGRSADRDPPERRTTAFRLVNEEGDALPGLAVDVYGAHLVAQLYASEEWSVPGRRDRVLDALHALGFDGIYLKVRPKQSNVLIDTRREDVAPRAPVRGEAAPSPLPIEEEGIPFLVRLDDGLSTGIFLDQRLNRRALRESARGASVANLFAYTCAFSVAAARGGAKRTVSVDASLSALERGREAFAYAGIPLGASHTFIGDDCFTWLTKAAKRGERYDVLVLDPPSYSSTKKRRFVADADYGELVTLAAALAAPGARILACCNHRKLTRAKLRRMLHEGARAAKREVMQLKDLPDAPDFPPPPTRDVHMKSLLLTLR